MDGISFSISEERFFSVEWLMRFRNGIWYLFSRGLFEFLFLDLGRVLLSKNVLFWPGCVPRLVTRRLHFLRACFFHPGRGSRLRGAKEPTHTRLTLTNTAKSEHILADGPCSVFSLRTQATHSCLSSNQDFSLSPPIWKNERKTWVFNRNKEFKRFSLDVEF